MIEAISTVTPAMQAAASSSSALQSHAQPFAPASASPVQAKHFAQHLVRTTPEAAEAPVKPAQAAPEATNAIRDRISQASKRLETGIAQFEKLEGELQVAADAHDLPKALSVLGKMTKETAVGISLMNAGVTASGASVGVFQNLMRVSER